MVWPDISTDWHNIDRPPDHGAKERTFKVFNHIDSLSYLQRTARPRWGTVPPNLPLDSIMPRPTERQWELMIGYMLHQGCYRPSPLTAWLVQRENAYYEGPGRTWDCRLFAYAAARDCICWQMDCPEQDALEVLAMENITGGYIRPM